MTNPLTPMLERMKTLHPKVIDLTLDRRAGFLRLSAIPQRALPPVIHVAGTNGKGSTDAMIRAGLEAAGQTVHAYTSPHLARFHERIRVAGKLITEAELTTVLDEADAANGGGPDHLFRDHDRRRLSGLCAQPADWTLLEVGLGGRHDATNVIDKPAPDDHHHGRSGSSAVPWRNGGRNRLRKGRDHQARRALRRRPPA